MPTQADLEQALLKATLDAIERGDTHSAVRLTSAYAQLVQMPYRGIVEPPREVAATLLAPKPESWDRAGAGPVTKVGSAPGTTAWSDALKMHSAGREYRGPSSNDVLAPGPKISQQQMLDEAARALGWRSDFACGDSPITWEHVITEIGARTIEQRRTVAQLKQLRDVGEAVPTRAVRADSSGLERGVDSCTMCPFSSDGTSVEQDDSQRYWSCHLATEHGGTGWARKLSEPGSAPGPMPPDWCPLRERPRLVVLDAHAGKRGRDE